MIFFEMQVFSVTTINIFGLYLSNFYLFKVNKRNTRKKYEITTITPKPVKVIWVGKKQGSDLYFIHKCSQPKSIWKILDLKKLYNIFGKDRRSHRRCSVRKGVLRNFAKFTGKQICQSLFFSKVADLRPAALLKKRLAQMFSCESCEIFKNTFLTEHIWATASEKNSDGVPLFFSYFPENIPDFSEKLFYRNL